MKRLSIGLAVDTTLIRNSSLQYLIKNWVETSLLPCLQVLGSEMGNIKTIVCVLLVDIKATFTGTF